MPQFYGRDFVPAELLGREESAVAGDHCPLGIDQDGAHEAEGLDALGDLADLFRRVETRVLGIEV